MRHSPCWLAVVAALLSWFPAVTRGDTARPRLVVLVTIDQLPHSYLARFAKGTKSGGFLSEVNAHGASYDNCRLRHAYTITGPGHTVVSTGAYPRVSGIIGNAWYDREKGESLNCVFDPDARIIGAEGLAGASPHKLLVPTIGDVLKLETNGKAKIFTLGIKDRAAIFTAGRLADGAFWLDVNSGAWVTSDTYRSDLPPAIRQSNESGDIKRYAGKTWKLLLNKEQYELHREDDSPLERPRNGASRRFPHVIPAADDANYIWRVNASPFGNEFALRTAGFLIEGEQLGKDDVPDLLAVNLSSNDYVGHQYGPYSLEVADLFYRTDAQLGQFARALDQLVGAGHWTILLTSDHGVSPIPEFLQAKGLPSGRDPLGPLTELKQRLNRLLRSHFPKAKADGDEASLVAYVESTQIFLNKEHPRLSGRNFSKAQRLCCDFLIDQAAVADAMTRVELMNGDANGRLRAKMLRSFHPARSGDVLLVLAPFHYYTDYAASHGSPWEYDCHVPLMLLGCGVRKANASRRVDPSMIAPTLAKLLDVRPPAAALSPPLVDSLR